VVFGLVETDHGLVVGGSKAGGGPSGQSSPQLDHVAG
jgi:hypothetical protein